MRSFINVVWAAMAKFGHKKAKSKASNALSRTEQVVRERDTHTDTQTDLSLIHI